MRGLSSSVLSVAAMGLSSLTTYLTFFDASYTLTMANADVKIQIQSGSSSSKGQRSAYYRFFVNQGVILSNRGKLALVVSGVRLFRSTQPDRCEAPTDKDAFVSNSDATPTIPVVVEPETIRHIQLRSQIKPVSAEANPDGTFDLPADSGFWCLKWTIFDPNGKRHEPMSPAFTLQREYVMEGDDRYPGVKAKKEFPREPIRLVGRGLY